MGILAQPAAVIESLKLPAGFTVCELGNQFYRGDGGKSPAERWYGRLGCGRHTSLDANGMASHHVDLNHPLSVGLCAELGLGSFDLVTDFGTGEHIFNQAQVWQTLHDLVKVGGYIAFDRPMNGWDDHCFYRIQPTLILDLAAANGYKIRHLGAHTIQGHGDLLFGLLQKTTDAPFAYPNQGKYQGMLAAGRPAPKRRKRWDVISTLVEHNNWATGAEIGVLNGATFFHLLEKHPSLCMIAVDEWSTNAPDYGDLTKMGEEFQEKAARYGMRAMVLKGRSTEMAAKVADGSLDFCFIDACHDYESVSADIAAWAPKVRKGGAVMGHDWNEERFPGVIRAVTERYPSVHLAEDHVWAVQA